MTISRWFIQNQEAVLPSPFISTVALAPSSEPCDVTRRTGSGVLVSRAKFSVVWLSMH